MNQEKNKSHSKKHLLVLKNNMKNKNILIPITLKAKRLYLVVSYLYEALQMIINRGYSKKDNEQANDYTLIKSLNQKLSLFEVGLYTNKSGRLTVGKIWKGNIKNLSYFALYQEIILYQVLSKVIKRVNHLTPKHLKEISVPKYFGFINESNRLGLFTEYIKGTSLTNSNVYKQYKYMKKCIVYLNFLGSHFSPLEKALVSQKTVKDDLLVYPLFLIIALIKRPKLAKDLIKGFLFILKNVPTILKHKENTLIHGDLHPRNILISKSQVKILDLEQTTFNFPMYEYIYSILCLSVNPELNKLLLKDINLKCKKDESFALCFQALAIKCSTHYLAGNLSKQKLKLCSQVLKLGLQLRQKRNNVLSKDVKLAVKF